MSLRRGLMDRFPAGEPGDEEGPGDKKEQGEPRREQCPAAGMG